MSAAPNVSILASNQPSAGGFTALVQPDSTTTSLVSCNYIIYPGNNITGTISNVPNNLYNRTVNVGSDNCSNLGNNGYSLFIDTSVCLPNHDYYVSVSTLYIDGTQSPFSSAVLLPLAASKITLNSQSSVTLTRSPDTYISQALIKVFFTQPAAPPSGNLSYTLGIQYIDGNGSNKFSLVPGLSYNTDSVQTTLIDANGIDEAYVAIQSVRNVSVLSSSSSNTISVSSTSELSNTVMAKDTDVPDPPRNLGIDYQYYTNQQAILSWNAPFSALLTDVAGFKVYRKVAGSFVQIGSVVFTTIGATYSYTDNVSTIALNTNVSYYVTSFRNNPSAESVPSQIVSIVIVQPSSAPQNASATGLQVTFTSPYLQDVTTAFSNPSLISGSTFFDYSVAQFTVEIIDVNNPSPSVIATNTVPYVASSTGYSLNFNNIAFATNGTINSSPGLYKAKIWLNTFDSSGNTIIGQASIVNFQSGPRPIISSVNGSANQWSITDALTSFTVKTSSLAPLVDLFIVYRKKDENTIEINRPTITTPVIDSLGNYIYSFNSTSSPPFSPLNSMTHLALNISAANAFGNGISTITGTMF